MAQVAQQAKGSSYIRFKVKSPKGSRIDGPVEVSIGPGLVTVLGIAGLLALLAGLGLVLDEDVIAKILAFSPEKPEGPVKEGVKTAWKAVTGL